MHTKMHCHFRVYLFAYFWIICLDVRANVIGMPEENWKLLDTDDLYDKTVNGLCCVTCRKASRSDPHSVLYISFLLLLLF